MIVANSGATLQVARFEDRNLKTSATFQRKNLLSILSFIGKVREVWLVR